MNFKQWLLESEGSGQEGFADRDNDNGCGWDLIYPTTAGDYVYDIDNPKWFWWLQWRWKRGEEIGRPLYNIDKEVLTRTYVAPYSKTAPDDKPWVHKPDDGTGYLGIKTGIDLDRIGVGPSHKEPLVMTGPRVVGHNMGGDPPLPPHTALGIGNKGKCRGSKNSF